jgi:hypothetical protein
MLSNSVVQYAAPIRLPPNSMVEDDKVALIMPEQVTSHSLTQVAPPQTPSPSPFSLSQVDTCFSSMPRLPFFSFSTCILIPLNEFLTAHGSNSTCRYIFQNQ